MYTASFYTAWRKTDGGQQTRLVILAGPLCLVMLLLLDINRVSNVFNFLVFDYLDVMSP